MKFFLAFLFIFFAAVLSASAQEKPQPEKMDLIKIKQAEMQRLDKMVGKWSGTGWIQQGKEKQEFTGTENVQQKIDGLALLVEGKFTDKNKPENVIHETIAILSYNVKNKSYDFKTYLAGGNEGNFILNITENGYEWEMDFPGNKIKHTIKIKDGIWNEIGKVSQDEGKTWFQFFEMNLKKQ